MKKKIIAILSVILIMASIVGCSNQNTNDVEKVDNGVEGTNSDANAKGEEEAPVKKDMFGFEEPVEIKIGLSWAADFEFEGGQDSLNNDWMDLYREHNINPKILFEVDSSQGATKLNTAIMSGTYPDIIGAGPSDYLNYAQTGVIADITDVFNEYATEETKAYFNTDGGIALGSAMVDGKLYGLPILGNGYDSVMVMFIRQDWLDALGLEMPTTMDELKNVAHDFTYNDPDENGMDDTYGLALNGVEVFSAVGGVQAFFEGYGVAPGYWGNNFTFVEKDGKVVWGGTQADEMKAGLTVLKEMYDDGSIPKDFLTMDNNAVFEAAGASKAGIWFAPMWGGMSANSNAIKTDLDAHVTSAPIPNGLGEGSSKAYFTSSAATYHSVSSKHDNPEVLIKLFNLSVQKLIHAENQEEFLKYYGENTVSTGWKTSLIHALAPLKNYDNYLRESEALITGDISQLTIEQTNDYNNMRAYLDMLEAGDFDPEDGTFQSGCGLYTVFGDKNGGYAAIDQIVKNNSLNPSAYNTLPTEAMSENYATLNTLAIETIIKIIVSDDVSTYDDFLENWYKLGGTEVTVEAQEWYDLNN